MTTYLYQQSTKNCQRCNAYQNRQNLYMNDAKNRHSDNVSPKSSTEVQFHTWFMFFHNYPCWSFPPLDNLLLSQMERFNSSDDKERFITTEHHLNSKHGSLAAGKHSVQKYWMIFVKEISCKSKQLGMSEFMYSFTTSQLMSITYWGRVTHICATIIGSDNGLSPGRHQAII